MLKIKAGVLGLILDVTKPEDLLDFCWVKNNKDNKKFFGTCELQEFKNLEIFKKIKNSQVGFLVPNDLIQNFEIDLTPELAEFFKNKNKSKKLVDHLIQQQIAFVLNKNHGVDLNNKNNQWAVDFKIKNFNKISVIITELNFINGNIEWLKANSLRPVLAEPFTQTEHRISELKKAGVLDLEKIPEKYQQVYSLAMGVLEWQKN